MMIPTFSKSWRQFLYHARHADAEVAPLASPRPGSTSTIATSTPRRTLCGKLISTHTLQDEGERAVAARCAAASNRLLGPRLEHHVEGTLGRPSDLTEAALLQDLGKLRLASLRAEGLADLLRERGRHADHGRCVVVEPADRVTDIVGRIVGGDRLDDHPGAARLQQASHVLGATLGISHVVQAVEHGDEVEVALDNVLGARI